MAETFQLEIVTPDRLVARVAAEEAQLPGKNGYLGILPGHAPLITELMAGELSYVSEGKTVRLAVVPWGFAEVLPDKVTVLAEFAEAPEQIDLGAAEKAKAAAEAALTTPNEDTDYDKLLDAVHAADTRIQVASGK